MGGGHNGANTTPIDGGAGTSPSVGDRISAFLELIRPYRDLLAAGIAVVSALSAAVSWAVAHFATETELVRLRCEMTAQVAQQIEPVQQGVYQAQIDWRTSQLKDLAHNSGASEQFSQLLDEISTLNNEEAEADKSVTTGINNALVKCGSAKAGKAQS